MGRVTELTTANSGFEGGKIGLAGDTLWLRAKKMTPRFRDSVVRVDPVNGPLRFYARRRITGTLELSGIYESDEGHIRNALGAMSSIEPITGVTVQLDTGVTLYGDLLVMSVEDSIDRAKNDIPYGMVLQFTGQIMGDGGSSDAFDGAGSGEIFTDLKEVTGAASMAYTRSYNDQREDQAVEPFIVVGISESSGVPLSVAEAAVVASMGGESHMWRGNNTLPFARITSKWAGLNLIVGELVYSRHALDCRAHQIEGDIGFIVRGHEGEIITGDSGSDPDNVCADLASGPFAIRFVQWRDRTVPYKIILLPCVWDTNPDGDANAETMLGTINSAAITIDGVSRPATELRFDGFKNVRKFTTPGGSKYFGYIKFSQLKGGWTDGHLRCARMEALPLEGNQTLPSYTVVASVIRLYDYDRVTFRTIAQLCPNCYS